MTRRLPDPDAQLAKATEILVEAAIAERAAEQACRSRPWTDRAAWIGLIDAVIARRRAVDELVRVAGL